MCSRLGRVFVEGAALRREAKKAKKDSKSGTLPPPVKAIARAAARRSELLLCVCCVTPPLATPDAKAVQEEKILEVMLRFLRLPVQRKTDAPMHTRMRDALCTRLQRAQDRASALRLLVDQLKSTRLSQVLPLKSFCLSQSQIS